MNRPDLLTLWIDGRACLVPAPCSVAAALAHAGLSATRRSVGGEPRAPFCGMGQCQECRVRIDGGAYRLACMVDAREGMRIETDIGGATGATAAPGWPA